MCINVEVMLRRATMLLNNNNISRICYSMCTRLCAVLCAVRWRSEFIFELVLGMRRALVSEHETGSRNRYSSVDPR